MDTGTTANAAEDNLLDDPDHLIRHIREKLTKGRVSSNSGSSTLVTGERRSAVLMVVTLCGTDGNGTGLEPCLVFNKRSKKVRQAGDLCFPGGGIRAFDKILSRLLRLPGLPLGPHFAGTKNGFGPRSYSRRTSLWLAAGLREAWEEMRLNPLKVTYLGALPDQRLVMFKHLIHPMVAWVRPGQHFRTNWEVDRIVYIPMKKLLDQDNYGRCRLVLQGTALNRHGRPTEFPCYFHRGRASRELLWGATFRITMDFLKLAFKFQPPLVQDLPIVTSILDEAYLNGSRPDQRR